MKNFTAYLFMVVFYFATSQSQGQTVIDLGKCNLNVTGIREIDSFKGEKGNTINPSRRDAKLVEIKLEGAAYADGVSLWNPKIFSVVFIYRGSLKISTGIALGIKYTNKLTGEKEETWFNEPDVSFSMRNQKNVAFSHYLIVEIPKEVTDFTLQGPAVIQNVRLPE